tara:strand:+ start:388 stop:942 length:555 start_codon:yes stop_codon:yes gene_type:complete
MSLEKISDKLNILKDDGACKHLLNKLIPDISLYNQDNILLKLKRKDTFRIIFYCYPMTGNPNKKLPKNWNNIPGARGCTSENISFRNSYEELIKLNSVPVGISTQTVAEIKEMTIRLNITHDILSDINLRFTNSLKLPIFKIKNQVFIKRLTLVVENSIIKKIFYPIFSPDIHFKDVVEWLKKN